MKNFFKFILALTSFLPLIVNAENFSLTPTDLPTSVPKFGKTNAFYTITNITDQTLNNNFVKSVPDGATQVDCSPKYCGATFNLAPNESCILNITIKEPIAGADRSIIICADDGFNCDIFPSLLNVVEGEGVPFVGIAGGYYSNNKSQYFPLLAQSLDNGMTWDYPKNIFQNLTSRIDPNFFSGLLNASACTGSGDKTRCIGSGYYCTSYDCNVVFPLIALGKENLSNWHYPPDIFTDLQTKIDPNLTGGMLNGATCSGSGGSALCLAAGDYLTANAFLPLVAVTNNGGTTWQYPADIFKNLTVKIDPNFLKGVFTSTSCSQDNCNRVCIANGYYCNDDSCLTQIPLLAQSVDDGTTWAYPKEIFTDLKNVIDPKFTNGYLQDSSCSGSKTNTICIATGAYNNDLVTLPLLAQSKNKGVWSYPKEIFTNLQTVIGHGFVGGFFNANSCTGSGASAVCIAAGAYFTTGTQLPLLAITRNGGTSWSYPDFIYTKLRTVVDPNLASAVFDGASCIGNGKKAVCMAAGSYCTSPDARKCESFRPLLALSTNGGKDWSYPTSVFKDLNSKIDPNFKDGIFTSVSCHGIPDYNFCMAVGQYNTTSFEIFPLVAISTDGGLNWQYPPYIFQNLKINIDPNFAAGSFFSAGTTDGDLSIKYKKPTYFNVSIV